MLFMIQRLLACTPHALLNVSVLRYLQLHRPLSQTMESESTLHSQPETFSWNTVANCGLFLEIASERRADYVILENRNFSICIYDSGGQFVSLLFCHFKCCCFFFQTSIYCSAIYFLLWLFTVFRFSYGLCYWVKISLPKCVVIAGVMNFVVLLLCSHYPIVDVLIFYIHAGAECS